MAMDMKIIVVTTCDIMELIRELPRPNSSSNRHGLPATSGEATIL